MSIKRAPRPEANFYLLDKRISEDERLSWASRGLLVFLLGKPDHWEVSVQHLINQTKQAAKRTGRDGTYAILKELELAGYLTRVRGRADGGEFGKVDYIVHESPQPSPHPDKPDTANADVVDSPDTDKPDTAEPDTANPTQVSTEGLVSTETSSSTDEKQLAQGATPTSASDGDWLEKDQPEEPRVAIPADMPGPKDQGAKTFKPWANYAITYRRRYGVYPIWNAKVAGQLSQLVDRVGADMAPAVAAYYLSTNSQFYVTKGHSVDAMLRDCETLAMQMQTGNQMTATRARQMDGTQANASATDEAKRLLDATWGE